MKTNISRLVLAYVFASSLGCLSPAYIDTVKYPKACNERTVFCVDARGVAVENEHDPRLVPGDSLTIDVVGSPKDLMPPPGAAAPKARTLRLESSAGSASSTIDYSAIDAPGPGLLMQYHITNVPESSALTVTLTQTGDNNAQAVVRPLNFNIGKAGYYFEAAFAFPTVFEGQSTIGTTSNVSGRNSLVHRTESTLGAFDNLSLAVNIYPFGGFPPASCPERFPVLKNGQGREAPRTTQALYELMPFVCQPQRLFRPIALQVATSIAHDAFREYMVGIGYSVVRGVVISAGVSFVRGQFFGPTMFEGQVVANGSALNPETKYMAKPYFGVALSPELLQAALEILNQAKAVGAVHPSETQ